MITALIIAGLLFFPSPITREPSRPQEIAITQWGEAYIGVAHNYMAGAAFYEADEVRVLKDNIWRDYYVVENGIYLCEIPRPNCNDETFRRMYEPGAIILATCWPRGGMTRGQWIIKMLPFSPLTNNVIVTYNPVYEEITTHPRTAQEHTTQKR